MPHLRHRHALAYLALASTTLSPLPAAAESTPTYTGDIIVKWKDTTTGLRALSAREKTALRMQVGQGAGTSLDVKRAMGDGAELLQSNQPADKAVQTAERIAQDPRVEYAVPDRLMQPLAVPNDPLFPSQRNLQAPSSVFGGANLPAAWDITTGSSNVVVAVLDTGYTDHPELAGRLLPGYDFVTTHFYANDGDGRDADAHDPGDGVPEGVNMPLGCTAKTNSWHGTSVMSVLAANANNHEGMAGVDWHTRILPVRVLGRCGGLLSDMVDGMRWAGGLPVPGVPDNPHPAKVINLSMGLPLFCTPIESTTVRALHEKGVTIVAASGNGGSNRTVNTPASCPHVIAVGAHTDSGAVSDFSDLGKEIALTAPGGGYPRAPLSGDHASILMASNDGVYTVGSPINGRKWTGTSFSSPTVAGVAALMIAAYPDITPDQIRAGLTKTARPHPAGTVCATDAICGAGMLDAAGAVAYAKALAPNNGGNNGGQNGGGNGGSGGDNPVNNHPKPDPLGELLYQAFSAIANVVKWFMNLFGF